MASLPFCLAREISANGYAVVPGAFNPEAIEDLRRLATSALAAPVPEVRRSRGAAYAVRSLVQVAPALLDVACGPPLAGPVRDVLGAGCGLVRSVLFDKPPERSWSLPWHQDAVIGVRDHRRPSAVFRNPTTKLGVPHVEAPREVLERMLFARVHLDDVTDANGPLEVIPGSHHGSQWDAGRGTPLYLKAGDVLYLRPLVAHRSLKSRARGCHRRVLHFEYAAAGALPDGYEWYRFVPVG